MPIRAVIIGAGNQSGQFTEKLVNELAIGPRRHGLIGVGIHDTNAGPEVRRKIRVQINKMGRQVRDLTRPSSGHGDDADIADLRALCGRAIQLKPDAVFLIADTAIIRDDRRAHIFHDLRTQSQARMFALCFTDDIPSELRAYDTLEAYSQPSKELDNKLPILDTVFIVRNDSPLAQATGGGGQDRQNELVAKSLAAMWAGPLHQNFRPSLGEQVEVLRNPPRTVFIGMAISSAGLTTKKRSGFFNSLFYPIARRSTRGISVDEAQERIVGLTDETMRNVPVPMTTVRPFPLNESTLKRLPIVVNVIAPFRPNDPKFKPLSDRVGQELTNALGYNVKRLSVVHGAGVDLTKSGIDLFKDRKGTFHCQACVLFAIRKDQISGNMPRDDEAPQQNADA